MQLFYSLYKMISSNYFQSMRICWRFYIN